MTKMKQHYTTTKTPADRSQGLAILKYYWVPPLELIHEDIEDLKPEPLISKQDVGFFLGGGGGGRGEGRGLLFAPV